MFGRNKARKAAVDAVDMVGPFAARLARDRKLRHRLASALAEVEQAGRRVGRKKRRHRLRTALLLLGGAAVATAFVPAVRRRLLGQESPVGEAWTTAAIDETIDVDVPVHIAYGLWTQFEQFPLFMEGVEDVREVDDATLHWVVSVAGKRGEWDARILERLANSRIAWETVDGKETRGTVSFESLGDDRTRIHLSMRYRAEGALETVGSAAGLDSRRVRGDLERFKDLVESPEVADRGEVESGTS